MNKLIIKNLSLTYSDGVKALNNITINVPFNKITVMFGPSGGGKSSLLRVINRLNDLTDVDQISGKVLLSDGSDNTEDILETPLGDRVTYRDWDNKRNTIPFRNLCCRIGNR